MALALLKLLCIGEQVQKSLPLLVCPEMLQHSKMNVIMPKNLARLTIDIFNWLVIDLMFAAYNIYNFSKAIVVCFLFPSSALKKYRPFGNV